MHGPVVVGAPVISPVIQIGQAPGEHEGRLGRPFAWTAGKLLFEWYRQIGADEAMIRDRVYMAAVCRCFPGRRASGGHRVPDAGEVERCATWLRREIEMLQPKLLIPVGKLAITQLLPVARLVDVIGRQQRLTVYGRSVDVIPLPHPSGLSSWHKSEPGRTLLQQALHAIRAHPSWRAIMTVD